MVQWAGGAGRWDCQRTAVALPVAVRTPAGVPIDYLMRRSQAADLLVFGRADRVLTCDHLTPSQLSGVRTHCTASAEGRKHQRHGRHDHSRSGRRGSAVRKEGVGMSKTPDPRQLPGAPSPPSRSSCGRAAQRLGIRSGGKRQGAAADTDQATGQPRPSMNRRPARPGTNPEAS